MTWAKRMLWFVFGAMAAGLLMVISTSYAVEPRQGLEWRVEQLEGKVAAIQERFRQTDAAAEEQRKAAEEQRKVDQQEERIRRLENRPVKDH
jgi:cell shape-determining protein MreC